MILLTLIPVIHRTILRSILIPVSWRKKLKVRVLKLTVVKLLWAQNWGVVEQELRRECVLVGTEASALYCTARTE